MARATADEVPELCFVSIRAAAIVSGIASIILLRSSISLVLERSEWRGTGETSKSAPLRWAGAIAGATADEENDTSRLRGVKDTFLPIDPAAGNEATAAGAALVSVAALA